MTVQLNQNLLSTENSFDSTEARWLGVSVQELRIANQYEGTLWQQTAPVIESGSGRSFSQPA